LARLKRPGEGFAGTRTYTDGRHRAGNPAVSDVSAEPPGRRSQQDRNDRHVLWWHYHLLYLAGRRSYCRSGANLWRRWVGGRISQDGSPELSRILPVGPEHADRG